MVQEGGRAAEKGTSASGQTHQPLQELAEVSAVSFHWCGRDGQHTLQRRGGGGLPGVDLEKR